MIPENLIGKQIGSVKVSDYIGEELLELVAPILFSHMKAGSISHSLLQKLNENMDVL